MGFRLRGRTGPARELTSAADLFLMLGQSRFSFQGVALRLDFDGSAFRVVKV